MMTHIPTGIQFESRLQAKRYFGTSNYNYRVRKREFTFHDDREIISDHTTTLREGDK